MSKKWFFSISVSVLIVLAVLLILLPVTGEAPGEAADPTGPNEQAVQGAGSYPEAAEANTGEPEDIPIPPVDIQTPPEYIEAPIAANKEPIHLVFAGDAMMDASVKKAIAQKGPDYPFVHVKKKVTAADIAFVNLETAVTNEKNKDTSQIFNFKSDSISLKGIKNAGFDVISVANNHVLDFQRKGLLDTLDHLEAYDLMPVGAGRNESEAFSARTVKVKGVTVKYLAFSRFLPELNWVAEGERPGVAGAYDQKKVLAAIEREREGADYLIVYMHWGIERNNRPEAWQRKFAKEMIDTGADAIIGSHPHVLQGFESYKSKPIAYSIGNFLFPDYVKGRTADTGLLNLTLQSGKVTMQFDPFYIKNNQIIPREKAYIHNQLDYLEALSYGMEVKGNTIQASGQAQTLK